MLNKYLNSITSILPVSNIQLIFLNLVFSVTLYFKILKYKISLEYLCIIVWYVVPDRIIFKLYIKVAIAIERIIIFKNYYIYYYSTK